MKKFEFTEKYQEHAKGEVIDMDLNIYAKFIHPLLMRGILKVIQKDGIIKEKVKEAVNEPTIKELDISTALSGKKMNQLRKLGTEYGAKDTSKSELIEEIIEKVPPDTIKKFLEEV